MELAIANLDFDPAAVLNRGVLASRRGR